MPAWTLTLPVWCSVGIESDVVIKWNAITGSRNLGPTLNGYGRCGSRYFLHLQGLRFSPAPSTTYSKVCLHPVVMLRTTVSICAFYAQVRKTAIAGFVFRIFGARRHAFFHIRFTRHNGPRLRVQVGNDGQGRDHLDMIPRCRLHLGRSSREIPIITEPLPKLVILNLVCLPLSWIRYLPCLASLFPVLDSDIGLCMYTYCYDFYGTI